MHRKVLLQLGILTAILSAVALSWPAHAALPPLKLSLPAALGLALSENRDLLVSRMSVQGDQFLIDAAEAEFAPKLTPSFSTGKTGTQPSFFVDASSTVS